MSALGAIAFKLAYEISPILLTNGIAKNLPGSLLPIVVITEAAGFVKGLLGGNLNFDTSTYFAHFQPLPGSHLITQEAATYPLANQAVAANAVIQQPLTISMKMLCPVRAPAGYSAKIATMIMLKKILEKHNSLGGTYTVMTPACPYTNCLLLDLHDITDGESNQPQMAYQWDFYQPLVTRAAAAGAQNSLMQKLTDGLPTDGATTGASTAVGNNDAGGPTSIPAASSSPGSSLTGKN